MVELRKSEALKKATIFSLLIMIGLGPLVGNANAFIYGSSSPSGWTVWVQDTPNTPQTCPWYDDAKGASGQHCNELLYVGVAWDDLYVYVRWDVKCLTTEFAQVYYLLRVAVNASAPTTTPTHSLQFEFNKIQGTIYTNVTIRIPGSPKFITAWTSNTDLSIDAIIPPLNTTVVNNETALIGRYPWSSLSPTGQPVPIVLIQAESHASESDNGWTSEIMDYIGINSEPVPWFTDLSMVLLVTTALSAVYLKKKGRLNSNIPIGVSLR